VHVTSVWKRITYRLLQNYKIFINCLLAVFRICSPEGNIQLVNGDSSLGLLVVGESLKSYTYFVEECAVILNWSELSCGPESSSGYDSSCMISEVN
jgi:hypothetical protein